MDEGRLNPVAGIFVRKGKFGHRKKQGEGHATTEAEIAVTRPQAKKRQRLLVITTSWKRHRTDFPSRSVEGTDTLDTSI